MREGMLKFIQEKKLFAHGDKLLVAVSGGADSVALCHLLAELNFNFIIAHCNFQLREQESEEDELFVKEIGKNLNTDVFVQRFDTKKTVDESKQSIQMVARSLRYEWFEELRKAQRCDYILTAHHKNDSLETVLLNLTKGTGIAGLHGIRPKNGLIARPLLFATKDEILEYLTTNSLTFREDSSNVSDKYQRNLIRNQVIKALKKINPALEETFDHFIEKISLTEEIFDAEVLKFKLEKVKQREAAYEIDVKDLVEETAGLIKLFEVLKEYGFNFSQSKDLFNTLTGISGKSIESTEYIALKDREKIIIYQKSAPSKEVIEIHSGKSEVLAGFIYYLEEVDASGVTITNDPQTALLDAEKLEFPLTLRNWQAGDTFVPLGMKGKKKISDYLIDKKIPLSEKADKKVLLSKGQVIWVVGERIDERFKITSKTRRVLRMTCSKRQAG